MSNHPWEIREVTHCTSVYCCKPGREFQVQKKDIHPDSRELGWSRVQKELNNAYIVLTGVIPYLVLGLRFNSRD
jgi:hypothetical protein